MPPKITFVTPRCSAKSYRSALVTSIVVAMTALSVSEAAAVSARVRISCASDYFAFCSHHAVGSEGLRQCMRTNGPKLSKRCINALVASGEVSQDEVARRAASLKR